MNAQPADGWRMIEMASDLARQGVEFALATVVWRQAPSSGHQGARAIITADGQMHGWIGGACAEPVVVREAQRAIEARTPRLILLGAPDQFGDVPEGMMFVQMSCQSEGALQLYIEPVLPSPHLVVVGRSPMAATLVDLASGVGWRADLVDVADFKRAHVGSRTVVVVATQGHGDEEAVEQAVTAGPAFVGLVASRKRGEAILSYLADRGVSTELLERVRVPVGIDLGHTSHPEIAVSVLAELVELRAKGVLDPEPVTTMSPEPIDHHDREHNHIAEGTAIDLVCGMTVPADDTSRPFEQEGVTYFFCCPGCRVAFEKDPSAYTTVRG
ncbi:MAG TPA: XdhC family protein [Acidimicrobiia bacterium]|nr:XdhC family protein [Acidimicrobiia bacterium]